MNLVEVALSGREPISAMESDGAVKADWLFFQNINVFFRCSEFNLMKVFEWRTKCVVYAKWLKGYPKYCPLQCHKRIVDICCTSQPWMLLTYKTVKAVSETAVLLEFHTKRIEVAWVECGLMLERIQSLVVKKIGFWFKPVVFLHMFCIPPYESLSCAPNAIYTPGKMYPKICVLHCCRKWVDICCMYDILGCC